MVVVFISSTLIESESRLVMSDSLQPHGLHSPWNSPGQNTGVGRLSLLQGIFPTQGSEPRSPTLQADSLPGEPPRKPLKIKWGTTENHPTFMEILKFFIKVESSAILDGKT